MILLLLALAPGLAIALYVYWRDKHEKEPVVLFFKRFVGEDQAQFKRATINIDGQPYPEKIFTVSSKRWNESS